MHRSCSFVRRCISCAMCHLHLYRKVAEALLRITVSRLSPPTVCLDAIKIRKNCFWLPSLIRDMVNQRFSHFRGHAYNSIFMDRAPDCMVVTLEKSIGWICCRLEENCEVGVRSKRHKQCRLPHRLRRQSQLNSYRRHRCNALCTKFTSFTLELRINHFWRSLEILISLVHLLVVWFYSTKAASGNISWDSI